MRQGVKHVMEMPLDYLYRTAVGTGTVRCHTTETLLEMKLFCFIHVPTQEADQGYSGYAFFEMIKSSHK